MPCTAPRLISATAAASTPPQLYILLVKLSAYIVSVCRSVVVVVASSFCQSSSSSSASSSSSPFGSKVVSSMPIHDPVALEQLRQAAAARRHHPVRASLSIVHDSPLVPPPPPPPPKSPVDPSSAPAADFSVHHRRHHKPGGSKKGPSSRSAAASRWLSVLPPKMYERISRDRVMSGDDGAFEPGDLMSLNFDPEPPKTNHRILANHEISAVAALRCTPVNKRQVAEGESTPGRRVERQAPRSSSMPDFGAEGPSGDPGGVAGGHPSRSPSWRLASPAVATVPENEELDGGLVAIRRTTNSGGGTDWDRMTKATTDLEVISNRLETERLRYQFV